MQPELHKVIMLAQRGAWLADYVMYHIRLLAQQYYWVNYVSHKNASEYIMLHIGKLSLQNFTGYIVIHFSMFLITLCLCTADYYESLICSELTTQLMHLAGLLAIYSLRTGQTGFVCDK